MLRCICSSSRVKKQSYLVGAIALIKVSLANDIPIPEAARLAKCALKEKRNVREILIEEKIVSEEEIGKILDPYKMI